VRIGYNIHQQHGERESRPIGSRTMSDYAKRSESLFTPRFREEDAEQAQGRVPRREGADAKERLDAIKKLQSKKRRKKPATAATGMMAGIKQVGGSSKGASSAGIASKTKYVATSFSF
jgi:hypothetical protein